MYGWEREALGIGTLGEIRSSVRASCRVDLGDSSRSAWWIATLPGLAIMGTILSINILGEALRQRIAPRTGTEGATS